MSTAPHVYARVSGFGWTLLPLAPFHFEQAAGPPPRIQAGHFVQDGIRQATLTFGGGPPHVDLGPDTARLGEVLDLMPGPDIDHWRIETSVFTVRWPTSFALQSSPRPPGFDLLGPEGTPLYIYVQGPVHRSRLPALEAMAAPGQSVRRTGRVARRSWVELEYVHEGRPWRQTHRVVDFDADRVVVVTAQSPEEGAAEANRAGEEVADSVRPGEATDAR